MYVGGLGIRNWLKLRGERNEEILTLFGNGGDCEISTFSSEFCSVVMS